MQLFLVAAPGLEAVIAAEAARRLPDAEVHAVAGGVELRGAGSLVARANLHLRLPTRVLLRLGEVEARDFAKLRSGVASLPLASFLPAGAAIALKASAGKSRLYHTGAIAENVLLAAKDAIGAVPAIGDEARDFSLLVRGLHDRFTISLDTSGERLHRRGWRTDGGAAPLRETHAAALLAIAGHDADEPLADPMCGAGTIAIEAALAAIDRAPGLDRTFAFMRYAGFDADAWERLRTAARAAERPRALPIVGSDADEAQLAAARGNAERAGVVGLIRLELGSLDERRPHAPRGLVATNAPYGRRVGARDGSLSTLYASVGWMLRGPWAAWRAAVLVEDRAALPKMGLSAHATPISNGGLRAWIGRRGD